MKWCTIVAVTISSLSFSGHGWIFLPSGDFRRGLSNGALTPSTLLYNIPPPSETNVEDFIEFASKQPPPSSFFGLQQDAIRATRIALRDGHKLLEIEFPPLPANVLDMDDVSAYDVAEANLNLSLEFSKGLLTAMQGRENGVDVKNIAIMFPDEAELQWATEKAGTANPHPGVTISSLRKSDPDDTRIFKPEQLLLNLFGSSGGIVKAIDGVDLYIILTASAQELPDVEELHNIDKEKPIIFYNLKLDVLRGDLGAPAFPSKDFQDRFLSKVKPVYYLRTRQYSRSTSRPPFVINYQGCLFRVYPGKFQTLLDTGTGSYRRLLSSEKRPPLGVFKEQLTDALKEQGILQEEGSTLNFLRTGYKTLTWWEEEREAADDAWRT